MRMFGQMRWSRACWAALGAAASAVVLVGGTAVAATGWTVVNVPQTGISTVLYGAFARTGTDTWVVGRQFGASGQPAPPPVAYHWNGSTWSLLTTPTLPAAASLAAVSASSATDAWAVGWTGGYTHKALTEHWNGSAWNIVTGPGSSAKFFALRGVADLSPVSAYAIGSDPGVAYHWDGAAWRTVTLPDAGFAASAITAVSATDIWLIGSTSAGATAEAMNFNGTAWTVVPMQQPSANKPILNGVTAVAANDIWAVGQVQSPAGAAVGTLTEHWNGSAWSIVPSPTPAGTFPTLTAVAARGSGDVYAVGSALTGGSGVSQGLILRWNGTTWSQDADPTGSTFGVLYAAAAAPGAAQEWAAGFTGSGPDQPLVLSYS
jgi:hypothetical protein